MSVTAKVVNLNEPSSAGVLQEASGTLLLERPSRVFLDLRPADIDAYVRQGADLIVDVDGEKLRIINFYHLDGDSQLYLKDEDCDGLLLAELSPAGDDGAVFAQYVPQAEPSPFESLTCDAGAGDDGYGMAAALAILGGAAAGLGLALGGGDDGGDSGSTAPSSADTTAPPVPAIDGVSDNVGVAQGQVASGGRTDDSTPTVSGSGATPGDTITLYDGATEIGSDTVANDGSWSITPEVPLNDGSYNFTVTATDPAGNESGASSPYPVIIDTTAPSAPTIDNFMDNVGAIQGQMTSYGRTDDATPTLNGSGAEANGTVNVYIDGIFNGSTTADASGNWSYTPPNALGDGSHNFTATSVDAAGNESLPGAAYVITIDTTAPSAPVISPTDGTVLNGTAEPGSTVNIDVTGDNNPDYTAQADANGDWNVDANPDLANGTVVTATATDDVGNVGPPDTETVDTSLNDIIAPAQPVIADATDDVDPQQGLLDSGDRTNDTLPTLNGTAEAGSTVNIFQDGVSIGSVTADGSGNWSYTPDVALVEGTYIFTVTATDAALNESVPSAAFTLTIDTLVPTLAITAADLALAAGEATTVTFQFSEAVTGFAAGDVAVEGGALSDFIQVDADTWTATFTQDGTATAPSISVANGTFTDLAGNPGTGDTLSGVDGFTADIVAPTLAITAADLALAAGEATTVTFQFSEAVTGFAVGDVAVAGGALSDFIQVDTDTWTATFTQDGTATAPSISVANGTFTDLAGNPGTGDTLNGVDGFTADIIAPTLAITAADLVLSAGEATTVTFQFSEAVTGFAAGDVVVEGGALSDFIQADADTWTATFTQDGTATAPSISVANGTFTDLAGNPGTGDTLNGVDGFTSDIVAPTVTFNDLITGDTTPALSGTVDDPTASVVVTINGVNYAATNNGDTTWTLADDTVAPLAGGATIVSVTATDTAGNTGTDTGVVTVPGPDTTAPFVTFNDLITNDTTPALTGAVDDPTATVVVTVDGVDYAAINNGNGTWTLADNTVAALGVGATNVTVTATDASTNIGSDIGTITVDTTAPTLAITAADLALAAGEATAVTFQFSEAVTGFTAGDVVVEGGALSAFIKVDADTWTATFTQDGTATAPSISVANGTFTDLAGNPGTGDTLNGVDGFTSDITSPVVAFDNLTTNDTTPPLTGTVDDAVATVTVTVDGVDYAATNNGDGTWTLSDDVVATLDEGVTNVTVTAIDSAGNSGTDTGTIVVDTTAPVVTSAADSVSEEALAGGIPDLAGVPADTTNLAMASGTMAVSDPGGAVTLVSVNGPAGLTSGGDVVTWSGSFAGNTYTLTGTKPDTTIVATLTLTLAGAYSFELLQALDHPVAGVEDVLGLNFTVTATDGAGNVSTPNSLTINVEDDMPVAADPALFSVTTTPATETGSLVEGYGADGGYVSQITIDGNTFRYDVDTDSITESGDSELVVSQSFNAATDELTIQTVKGETIVVDMVAGDYSYAATGTPLINPEVQVAPEVSVNDSGSLLGIVGADALGLIDLSANQALKASDGNNDIEQVVVNASAAISIGLGAFYHLAWSEEMAAEFGLTVVEDNDILNLVLVTTQSFSSLTITAADGGSIDNLQLNEFLATVYVEQFGILNLAVTPTMSISATDSQPATTTDASVDLLGLSLLDPESVPDAIQEGTIGADTLTGVAGQEDRLYGYAGNDTLSGLSGNDILRGGGGTDSLVGGDGNDILIGGAGPDTLTGGSGNDVFLWEAGGEGSPGTPAIDTIADFNTQPLAGGGDIIDLGNLLQGEGKIGNNPGNLTNYLHFEVVGGDTVLSISTTGQFVGGYNAAAVDQQISFTGVDLIGSFSTDQEVIAYLLSHGNLIVDEATTDTNMLAGTTTVNAVITDNDGDTASTSVSFDSTGATPPPPSSNVAPVVQTDSSALLGIISAGALNIINLDTQDLTAADSDGNLLSVAVAYQPLLSVDLEALQLSASSQLAAELGLQFSVVNDPGLLGLVAPSSVLVITAVDGGDIDNLAVNELLATVQFDDAFSLLGPDVRAAVLDATTITAFDSEGLSASDSLGNLLTADALNTLEGNVDIIEGTSGNDTLESSLLGAENERLYGHDGNDTLSGSGGSDLLRGGAGDDVLNGGDGNDVLIDGNGSDSFNAGGGDDIILISGNTFTTIDGGDGFDIVALDEGIGLNLDGVGDNVSNVEGIDMAYDDTANSLTLTAEAVESLTDVDNQLYITGESNDTLNVVGAVDTGTETTLNGAVFDVYTFGINELLVDQDVVVNAA